MRRFAKLNFYTILFILLISLVVVSSQAQQTKPVKCGEMDYECLLNEYSRSVSLECKPKGYKYECLMAQWTKIIESNPNSGAAYLGRGRISNSREPERAIQDYNKAIELNPAFFRAYYELGINYLIKKDYNRAIIEITKALEVAVKASIEDGKKRDRNIQNAYIMRGQVYFQTRDFGKALADYNQVIELYPKNNGGYLGRGDVYAAQGNNDKALTEYNKAIELAPNDFVNFHYRGNFYLKIGEKEKGEADLKRSKNLRATFYK